MVRTIVTISKIIYVPMIVIGNAAQPGYGILKWMIKGKIDYLRRTDK